MHKDGSKSGGKKRAPASSEGAAAFRVACDRLGIDAKNCRHHLGISKSVWYDLGNGLRPVNETLWKLLESIDSYRKLHAAFVSLQLELENLRGADARD